MWNVVQYLDSEGKTPVQDELAAIYARHGTKEAKEIRARLKVVIKIHVNTQKGQLQPRDSSLHRVDEFWQIRSKDVRILLCCSLTTPETLVMLHAFEKRVKNTPPAAIATARRVYEEYKQRQTTKELNHDD